MRPANRRDTLLGQAKRDFPRARPGDLLLTLGGGAVGAGAAESLVALVESVDGASGDPRRSIAAAALGGAPITVSLPVGQDEGAAHGIVRRLFETGWEPRAVWRAPARAPIAWVTYPNPAGDEPTLDFTALDRSGGPALLDRSVGVVRSMEDRLAAGNPGHGGRAMEQMLRLAAERDARRNAAVLKPPPARLCPTDELRGWAIATLGARGGPLPETAPVPPDADATEEADPSGAASAFHP